MFQPIWQDDLEAVKKTFGSKNVNTPDKYGRRPLHIACLKTYPSYDIVSYLLGKGASIDFDVEVSVRLIVALRKTALSNPFQEEVLELLEKVQLKNALEKELA